MANFIKKQEKDPNIEEKENFLWKTLEQINRPQYAIANAIYQAYKGGDVSTGQALWDGLTLKEKKSVGDTLQEIVQPDTTWGKAAVFAAGFAGDVLTDPLTWTGVGLLTKGKKLAKAGSQAERFIKAGRSLDKAAETKAVLTVAGKPIPKTETVIDPLSRYASQVGIRVREDLGVVSDSINALQKVSTRMRPRGVDPVSWEKFLIARDKAINKERFMQLSSMEKVRNIYKSFKDEGLTDQQIADLADEIESGKDVVSKGGMIAKETTQQLQDVYRKVGSTGQMIFKKIIEEDGYNYLPHVLDKQNKKITNDFGFGKKTFTTTSVSDIGRTILKYVDEKGTPTVFSTKTGKVFKDGKQLTTLRQKDINKILSLDAMEDFLKRSGYGVDDTEGLVVRKGIINVEEAKEIFKDTEIPELLKIAQLQQLSKMYKDNPEKIREILASKSLEIEQPKKKIDYKTFKKDTFNKKIINQEDVLKAIEDSGIEDMLTKYKSTLLKKEKTKAKPKKTGKTKAGDVNIFKLLDVDKKLTGFIKQSEKLGLNKVLDEIKEIDSPSLLTAIGKKTESLRKTYGKVGQARIAEVNKAYGKPVFITDLPKLVAIQGLRTAKIVKGDTFFKEAAKFGSSKPKKVKGVEYIESSSPELANKYFHPEIEKHIQETTDFLTSDKNAFFEKIFQLQDMWKTTATLWNLPFHTRNAISNYMANQKAGIFSISHYKDAMRLQKGVNLSKQEKAMLKEYKNQGLARVGLLSGDVERNLDTEIMSYFDLVTKKKNPFLVLNKLGGKLGDVVETNAKLAHFIAKRKQGLSAFDAGNSVKKYLFDYEDLTRTEKAYFKRVIPFYTFSRKNIPVQLETILKNPNRQTVVLKLKNNVEVMVGDDETNAILPEWLRNATPVFLGKNKEGKVRYVALQAFLPSAELNKISDPAKEMLNMVSPLLKMPFELQQNRNFFFGEDITKQKGIEGFTGYGEKDMLWWRIPGRLNYLASMFRPLNEINKLVGRQYKDRSRTQKVLNVVLGSKLYEYTTRDLLRQFDYLAEDEARGLIREVTELKKQIRKYPEQKEEIRKDIKHLRKLIAKEKKEASQKKRQARKSLRG